MAVPARPPGSSVVAPAAHSGSLLVQPSRGQPACLPPQHPQRTTEHFCCGQAALSCGLDPRQAPVLLASVGDGPPRAEDALHGSWPLEEDLAVLVIHNSAADPAAAATAAASATPLRCSDLTRTRAQGLSPAHELAALCRYLQQRAAALCALMDDCVAPADGRLALGQPGEAGPRRCCAAERGAARPAGTPPPGSQKVWLSRTGFLATQR